jgi:putative ABC transport system permease protein
MIRLAFTELGRRGTQHVATILVAVISSVFATTLIEMTIILQAQSASGGYLAHSFIRLLLSFLGIVFLFVATFVSCIVTANTFAIIMAGRIRRIALLRLIGASARVLRGAVVIEGAVVGAAGAMLGVIVGVIASGITNRALVGAGVFTSTPTNLLAPTLAIPILIGVASTTGSAYFGSRSILQVSPIEATARTEEPSLDTMKRRSATHRAVIYTLTFGGLALLLVAVGIGSKTPYALLLAVPGGAASFLGFIFGSAMFIPRLLNLAGHLTGHSAASALAQANATRYPARTSRSTVGLIIGVTLVTMFSVATQSFTTETNPIAANAPGAEGASDQTFLNLVTGILVVLIGFSLVIAAIGLANSLSLGVLQRRKEIGLLRALGFTRAQVRLMIFAEAVQLSAVGAIVGLVLGIFYGWAGANTAIASDGHIGHLFAPSVPIALIVLVILGAGVLAIAAALLPSVNATRITPVAALAHD